MIRKKKGQKYNFFGESDGALRMGACRGGHHTNPISVPRKTLCSPAALENTSGSNASVVDALPVDGQLDPTYPDFRVIFLFTCSRLHPFEPPCIISSGVTYY